jgi:hypothetical protein
MKVDAFFLLDIEALVKQVHQKRLAAADATPYIESTYGLARLAPEEHCAQPPFWGPLRGDTRLQVLETSDYIELCGVPGVALSTQAGFVGFSDFQTTLVIVCADLLRQSKITCQLLWSLQRLLEYGATRREHWENVGRI